MNELDDRRLGDGVDGEIDLDLGMGNLGIDDRLDDHLIDTAPIRAEMSSAGVEAGRTVIPVIIDSSSIVITFEGSAIASRTVSSERKLTGSA